PREVIKVDDGLEYGKNVLTIHKDAIKPGQRVLITDDLLATGGTIEASIKLVEQLGGIVVGCAFLIELSYLNGMERLKGYDVLSLMTYRPNMFTNGGLAIPSSDLFICFCKIVGVCIICIIEMFIPLHLSENFRY